MTNIIIILSVAKVVDTYYTGLEADTAT